MTERCDVLVLGLGPAGASAAAAAARRGCKVIALDRKKAPGVPVQCAEFVPALLKVDARTVKQTIDSMLTFVEDDAPDRTPGFPGRMLDRAAFDASLVEQARQAGVDCRFGRVFKNLPSIRSKVVIGADGPRSIAGKAIGRVNTQLVETRQVTVPLLASHTATDIFLSAGIPGGYGWLFPKGDLANVGAGVSPEYRGRLKGIVEGLLGRLAEEGRVERRIVATTGGAIPVGGMLKPWGRHEGALVLLAGDAAGLTNPVTGAGIAAAVQSGRLAGEAAADLAPERYEEELEDLFGAALERAVRRRKELLASKYDKPALRRGWIAYGEYWQ